MNIYDRQLAISGGTLHHIGLLMQASERKAVALVKSRCAWCDKEDGRKPDPAGNESHGICQKHLEGMKSELETMRRQTVLL